MPQILEPSVSMYAKQAIEDGPPAPCQWQAGPLTIRQECGCGSMKPTLCARPRPLASPSACAFVVSQTDIKTECLIYRLQGLLQFAGVSSLREV